MKSLPSGLQAHLDSGTTTLAWCWKITRSDGAVFGFTDHDLTLTFAGTSFEPESGFVPSEIRAAQDFSVDAQDVEGALSSDRITETDILDGRWDNAGVEVWRVNWAAVDQRVLMRRGNLGDIRRGRTSFVAEVRSLSHWLNQTVGRTYQFSCDADLGDARCGVNLSSPLWSAIGTVATLSGSRGFTSPALGSFAADTFTLGVVNWTSGANAGRKAEIASFAGGAITLFEAPVRPIAVGDAFIVSAGCDRQFATCSAKFGNGVNFRGFPHMPGEEAVLRYPNQGDANNGAPLT
ncbi:MAG: DUF2163 domain-containing protein [Rhodobacteraceae bacterium]|nr:DUF2163 domain-containing protein [Paracoccaceae bacterium]